MFSEKLINRIIATHHVAVLTGAGISAESGVPTFRGKEGLWNNRDVMQMATQQTLKVDPELFWEFYNWRRDLLTKVKPNLGHYALVDLENRFPEFNLITQNVDSLHRLAGSQKVSELHGNIRKTFCNDCGYEATPDDDITSAIPKCPKCEGIMRPGVVLFGESLPHKILADAQEAAATCEVFFSIGTSSLVEPAASLPYIAKGNGAYLVEINMERTPLSGSADEVILGKAGDILPHLVIALDK